VGHLGPAGPLRNRGSVAERVCRCERMRRLKCQVTGREPNCRLSSIHMSVQGKEKKPTSLLSNIDMLHSVQIGKVCIYIRRAVVAHRLGEKNTPSLHRKSAAGPTHRGHRPPERGGVSLGTAHRTVRWGVSGWPGAAEADAAGRGRRRTRRRVTPGGRRARSAAAPSGVDTTAATAGDRGQASPAGSWVKEPGSPRGRRRRGWKRR